MDNTPVLDAALEVFLRYGFRRATMGDIAQAAGLSRQSLYTRFANKDEVYAAGLDLFGGRIVDALRKAWAQAPDLGTAMDAFDEISVTPTYLMMRQNPDAADLIDAAATPDGKAAMARVTALKCAALSELFAPHSGALKTHGLTPEHLAQFVETNKQAILSSAQNEAQLAAQLITLKASVLSLTAPK